MGGRHATKTVLLVEDEEIQLRNLSRALMRNGISVVGASSAAEARRRLEATPISLACIDIQLGDGDGIDLVASMKGSLPELPVVVMTGRDSVRNRTRAEQIDATAFLAKPFALARFREIVATLLEEVGPDGARPPPSVMMYSHDTIGLGHMRRNSAIAAEITATMPDASVLLLVGSPVGAVFDLAPGVDFIKLPTLSKVSRNVWRPGNLRISSGDVRALRSGLILRAVETCRPDILVVDHEPLGVWDELLPALRHLRADPAAPHVILGLRDILDEPSRTRRDWQARRIPAVVRDCYDEILVYGSERMFPTREAYRLDQLVDGPVRYCGYVTSAKHAVRDRRRASGADPTIVVSGGGGRDAYPQLNAALSALSTLPRGFADKAVVIAGPLMDEELRTALEVRARADGIQFMTYARDVPELLRSADLFVTMGGYNSLAEAVAVGCPTLVIPRVGPSAEQRIRADAFARAGMVETLSKDEATAERLAARFRATVAGAAQGRPAIPLDGAATAASRIVDILSARHPDRAVIEKRRTGHA